MITRLHIENFKALRGEHDIPVAPITLLYGPNSGGKSSVLQALLLLKQTVEAERFSPRGSLVDLGSYHSCVWQHDLTRPIRLGIVVDSVLSEPASVDDPNFRLWGAAPESGLWLGYGSIALDERGRSWQRLETLRYRVRGPASPALDIRLRHNAEGAPRSQTNRYRLVGAKTRQSLRQQLEIRDQPHSPQELSLYSAWARKPGAIPDELRRVPPMDEIGLKLVAGIEAQMAGTEPPAGRPTWHGDQPLAACRRTVSSVLGGIRYVGPLRATATRTYSPVDHGVDWVGIAGENTTMRLKAGLAEPKESPYRARFLRWLRALEIPYKFQPTMVWDQVLGEGIRATLVDERTKASVGLTDVGSGVGQALPLLVQAAFAGAQVMCVEQPELHLHPRAQAALGDVLIESARAELSADQALDATQWIVETHSETLLLRIKRRIREGLVRAESVSVLYVEPSKTGSRVIQLRLNEKGDFIDEWPRGFFEESFNEVFS